MHSDNQLYRLSSRPITSSLWMMSGTALTVTSRSENNCYVCLRDYIYKRCEGGTLRIKLGWGRCQKISSVTLLLARLGNSSSCPPALSIPAGMLLPVLEGTTCRSTENHVFTINSAYTTMHRIPSHVSELAYTKLCIISFYKTARSTNRIYSIINGPMLHWG